MLKRLKLLWKYRKNREYIKTQLYVWRMYRNLVRQLGSKAAAKNQLTLMMAHDERILKWMQ